jgi:hypothetical protein
MFPVSLAFTIPVEGRGLAIFPLLGVAGINLNYPKLGKYFSFCGGRV